MQNIIGGLIGDEQTAYIKKRFIGNNIRLLDDVIEYSRKLENMKGAIIFLDFKKAFDSLEWNFIVEVLRTFNFGENFIRWIQTLYSESIACVKNNCWQSDFF